MDERKIFLRDVLTTLFKHKYLIIGFAVLVVALVFAGNYVWPETYESMAQVQVKRGRETATVEASVLETGAALPMVQMNERDVNTVINLLYSNDVLLETAREAGLAEGMAGGLMRYVRDGVGAVQRVLGFRRPSDELQDAADELRRSIHVDPVADSYTITVRVRMGEPELAQQVLARLLVEFKEKYREIHSTEELKPFFDQQLQRVRDQRQRAQQRLETFRNQNNVVALDTERELLVQDYAEAKRLLDQLATTERAAEALEDDAGEGAFVELLSRETESTVVTELQLRLVDKLLRRNEMMTSKGPRHPDVQGIRREIQQLNDRLQEAIESTRETTRRQMAEIESQMQKANALLGELANLEQDVKLADDSYEYYSRKREEAMVYDMMSSEGISSIVVTSQPTLPDNPIRPRRLVNIVLALIGGLIGGLALAFILDYFDHSLRTPEDVDHYLEIPALGSFWRKRRTLDQNELNRVASGLLNPALGGEANRFVAVAGSVQGEGAYEVARGLAETLARDSEKRTLFLDLSGDALGAAPDGRGIVDVAEGRSGLSDVIGRRDSLYVVGKGSEGAVPTYLWNSERMAALLENLRGEYDHVVAAVPPILDAPDARHLTHHGDGLLLVVRSGSTRREVVQRALNTLGQAERKVAGAVLTGRKQHIPNAVYRYL